MVCCDLVCREFASRLRENGVKAMFNCFSGKGKRGK
jgi:hypothetical protein